MKKSVRITVSIIVLVLLGLSISLNVYLGIAGGFIKQSDSLSGSVNENWNTHQVHIANGETSREFYYSHNQTSPTEADHICDVHLGYTETGIHNSISISYNTAFESRKLESEFYVKDSAGKTNIVEENSYISGRDGVIVNWDGHHEGVYIEKICVRSID